MLIGAILINQVEKYQTKKMYHELLIISIAIMASSSLFFTYTISIWPLAIEIFLLGISYSVF